MAQHELHDVDDVESSHTHRPIDVRLDEKDDNLTFADLHLHPQVVQGLAHLDIVQPSPIQLLALPLAKAGQDIIAQSKSGTGKTCVFAVMAIENILKDPENTSSNVKRCPRVLILEPTREMAIQVRDIIRSISINDKVLCEAFIGGLSVADNKAVLAQHGCDIVVGTPGRINVLLSANILYLVQKTKLPKFLFVVDEVDKIMAPSSGFRSDVKSILKHLPSSRQVLVFSATFLDDQILASVRKMMSRGAQFVQAPTKGSSSSMSESFDSRKRDQHHRSSELWLHGVHQFSYVLPNSSTSTTFETKVSTLAHVLSHLAFDQCIVFCNDKPRARALASALSAHDIPSTCLAARNNSTESLHPQASQRARLEAMAAFRTFAVRVLVSTDVASRGIDVGRVSLVVNLDLPQDPATYLHRVGRCGRFGRPGVALTLATDQEAQVLEVLAEEYHMAIPQVRTLGGILDQVALDPVYEKNVSSISTEQRLYLREQQLYRKWIQQLSDEKV